jgi:PAS domain S-box-containing protein
MMPQEPPEGTPVDSVNHLKRVVEELHTHQMELETQNEDLRRSQLELQESRNRYADLYDFAPVGYLSIDKSLLVIQVNRTFASQLDVKKRLLLKRGLSHCIAEDYQNAYYGAIRKCFDNGEKQTCEIELMRGDGASLHTQMECVPLKDVDGRCSQVRITITDITPQKQAETALQKRTHDLNEKVRELNCLVGISKLIEDPVLTFEAVFLGIVDLIPSAWPYEKGICCRLILEGEEYRSGNYEETTRSRVYDIMVKGNRAGTLEINSQEERSETAGGTFPGEKGDLINIVCERLGGIIERMLVQDQIIRSERLAAAGKLATSIAHEINSPLQGITALLHSMERSHGQDEKLLEDIELLNGGFMDIRDTVRKLLDLNRPGKEKMQSMNINNCIEDTLALLRSHLKKNSVKIILNLSPEAGDITASPQQLGQVLMNLINNAVEAMTGIPTPKDGPKPEGPAERKITIASNLRNEHIIVEVADTGPGISKEDMAHIFDPFYTRKKQRGVGMGLSLCHDILEDHKGSIGGKNAPDGGAVFTITLPIK